MLTSTASTASTIDLPYDLRRDRTSRQVAEESDAKGGLAFRQHRAKRRHLQHAPHRTDLRLAHLRHAMKHELDGLLIEWGDRDLTPSDPAVLVGSRELFREALLDPDAQLVQRGGQHGSRCVSVNVVEVWSTPFTRESTMSLLGPASPRQLSFGIALVRIITGIIFAAHGYQKFFVYGLDGATGAFTQMGIPAPAITAPLVAIVELAGGIALIIGLLTRLAALGLLINMLGAIFLVRLKGGFFAPNGAEFEILLAVASLALVIAGSGALSADEAIARRRSPAIGDAYGRTP